MAPDPRLCRSSISIKHKVISNEIVNVTMVGLFWKRHCQHHQLTATFPRGDCYEPVCTCHNEITYQKLRGRHGSKQQFWHLPESWHVYNPHYVGTLLTSTNRPVSVWLLQISWCQLCARPSANTTLNFPDSSVIWITSYDIVPQSLTHLPLDKMAAISQTAFSDAFREWKDLYFN